jgi:hypothetical protein
MAGKLIRQIDGYNVLDPSAIAAIQHSDPAGSQKVSEVGRLPLPFPYISGGAVAYTTNLTTSRPLPRIGLGLAVYNNDTSVHSITVSQATTAALAAGVTNAGGNVGIPCTPGTWTYIATGVNNWVVADSANLLVFLIADNTSIVNQIPAQVPGY